MHDDIGWRLALWEWEQIVFCNVIVRTWNSIIFVSGHLPLFIYLLVGDDYPHISIDFFFCLLSPYLYRLFYLFFYDSFEIQSSD